MDVRGSNGKLGSVVGPNTSDSFIKINPRLISEEDEVPIQPEASSHRTRGQLREM